MRQNYKLTLAEQETTVTMSRDLHTAQIYTSDRLVMSKLDKLCADYPDTYKCEWVDKHVMGDGLPMGKRYTVNKKYVKFRKPASAAKIESLRRAAALAREAAN